MSKAIILRSMLNINEQSLVEIILRTFIIANTHNRKQFDIHCLKATWLTHEISNKASFLNNLSSYRNDRSIIINGTSKHEVFKWL